MAASDPTTELALQVLNRAIQDLFCMAEDYQAHTPSKSEKLEAIRFFTDESGSWASSREHWCLAADQDPDAMRESVLAFLKGDDRLVKHVPPVRGIDHLMRAVAETREIYRAHVEDRDSAMARWRAAAEQRRRNAERRRHNPTSHEKGRQVRLSEAERQRIIDRAAATSKIAVPAE